MFHKAAKSLITPEQIKRYALRYLEKFNASSGYLSAFLLKKIKTYHLIDDIENLKHEISLVIAELQKIGYLNDTKLCESRIKSLLKDGNPIFVIKIKLQQKNITSSTIEESFNKILAYNTDDTTSGTELEEYSALKYAKKRMLLSYQNQIIDEAKVLAVMLRKGFYKEAAEAALNYSSNDEVVDFFNHIEGIYNI